MEKQKKKFYSEVAYVLGVIILALGTAMMTRADFGLSMVVAPAYLIHLKVAQILPWFTFGWAEYSLQAVLIVVIILIVRKLNISYLFSVVTILFYGFSLDTGISLLEWTNQSTGIGLDSIAGRVILFVVGLPLCSMGVSMLFNTYLSPEAYEFFVKDVSKKFNIDINKFKTGYDIASCIISIILSFAFFGFGHFEGIYYGTIICALLNGFLISRWTLFFNHFWKFDDALPFRKYFE